MRKRKGRLCSVICILAVLICTCSFGTVVPVNAAPKVRISDSKRTIYVGESYQLKLKNTSGKYKVKWSSNNKAVASVSSKGKVKAKKKGTAKIIANYRNKKYSCDITVKNVAVKNVLLNTTSLSLTVGGTYQLQTTVLPENATNKTVKYTSSNPSVVSVDSTGLVTALTEGSGNITAKAGNQSIVCAVVVKKTVNLTGVSISQTSLEIVKGKTATLLAELTPYNATEQVIWSTSNKAIATVNADGLKAIVKGEAKGTAVITVKDAAGKFVQNCTVTVVNPVPVELVTIYPKDSPTSTSTYTTYEGGTEQMEALVLPAGATDAAVTWNIKTEDGKDASKIATISASGVFTAKTTGKVIVTAAADGVVSNALTITIEPKIPVTSIEVKDSVTSIEIKEPVTVVSGKETSFVAVAMPENASFRKLIVSTDNASIATAKVGSAKRNGGYEIIVKGIGEGTCKLTLRAEADNVSKEVSVTVEKSVGVSNVVISGKDGEYEDGQNVTINTKIPTVFTYTVNPPDANQTVEWKVDWNSINPLEVPVIYVPTGNTITITGIQKGEATLRVLADGVQKASINIKVE